MGRKKAKRAAPAGKLKAKLPTTFDCPFCCHEKAVSSIIDKRAGVGSVKCNVCGQSYHSGSVHALTEAVDLYCEWIDACEAVANK